MTDLGGNSSVINCIFIIQRKLVHCEDLPLSEQAISTHVATRSPSSASTQVFLPTTTPSCNCNTDTAPPQCHHRRGRHGEGRVQAAADRAAPTPSPTALPASRPSQVGQPAEDARHARRNQNDHTRRHRVQQVGQREPLKQKLFQQHDKTYQRRRSTDSAAGIARGFPHPAATSVGRAAAGLPWHRGLFGRRW